MTIKTDGGRIHYFKTFGDFINRIGSLKSTETCIFLEDWKASPIRGWEENQSKPLTKELVLAFAKDAASYFRHIISSTFGEELYVERKKQGHSFLRQIHSVAKEFGVNINVEEIDVPLTPTDAFSR